MAADPELLRRQDLRRWRAQFPDVTAIADLRPRQPASCVGVVTRIRLVPGRSLAVAVEDGSGDLTAVWTRRSALPGLELGAGMLLAGTVAVNDDGDRSMRNPSWTFVAEPYG